MKKLSVAFFTGICVAFFLYFFLVHREALLAVKEYIEGAHRFSALVYVFLLTSVGIYLPLNAIPIIPLGAIAFGPFYGALLSSFGWTLGATGAFLIARHYGRKVVEEYVSLSKLDRVMSYLPENNRFFALLLFRLVFPSDMASYALGLAQFPTTRHYIFATAIAYSFHSFLLSYLGHAVFEGKVRLALLMAFCLLAIFLFGWYLLKRLRN